MDRKGGIDASASEVATGDSRYSQFEDPKFTDNGGLHPNFAPEEPGEDEVDQALLPTVLGELYPVCLSGLSSGCYDYELRTNRLRRIEEAIAKTVVT